MNTHIFLHWSPRLHTSRHYLVHGAIATVADLVHKLEAALLTGHAHW